MNSESQQLNTSLRAIGSFIAIVLPFAQFAFKWFPEQISGLFLNKEIIFFTTLITFFLSVFIIFISISHRHFRKPFNKSKQKKYFDYLRNTDPKIHTPQQIKEVPIVNKPFEITMKSIAIFSVLIVFISSLSFIWIGINYSQDNVGASFVQSLLYIITFVLTVFITTTYTISEYEKKIWLKNRKERIKKAINLAKENDSFVDFPKINFYYAKEDYGNILGQFIVEVYINDKNYRIITDMNADTLHAVYEVSPTKNN